MSNLHTKLPHTTSLPYIGFSRANSFFFAIEYIYTSHLVMCTLAIWYQVIIGSAPCLTIFYSHFQEFGKPLGIYFNLCITKILTSASCQSPLSYLYLSPQNCVGLQSTINYLKISSGSQKSPEITTGACSVSFLIGCTTFANYYITKLFDIDLSKLTSQIHDL